jgi:hypothetical protein
VIIPSYLPSARSVLNKRFFSRLCHFCGLVIEGAFVGTLRTTRKFHLQCFRSTGGHEDHESIPQVTEVTKSLLRETQPGVASAEQRVKLWQYHANLVFKPGEAVVSPNCKYSSRFVKLTSLFFVYARRTWTY